MAGVLAVPPVRFVVARSPGDVAQASLFPNVHQGTIQVMNDRIVIDPAICHGKPVLAGTRVPVSIIVGSLAAGMTTEEIQREYDVTHDQIKAALEFANSLIEREEHHPLPI